MSAGTDVLKVMSLVLKSERTQAEAARLLRRSVRQVRRIQRKLKPDFLRQSLEGARGLRLAENADERNKLFREYYRLIEGLDFGVGELLKELDHRGLAQSTVIVFTSDNGPFAGEHGFMGKWFMHEESLRVPMLVLDPRLAAENRGRSCDAMISTWRRRCLKRPACRCPRECRGEACCPCCGTHDSRGARGSSTRTSTPISPSRPITSSRARAYARATGSTSPGWSNQAP